MNLHVTSVFLVLLVLVLANVAKAWDVDFSRRKKSEVFSDVKTSTETPRPAVQRAPSHLEGLVTRSQPVIVDRQELVILNTGKGFVPTSVRIHKGLHYRVHIVNVNDEKKNVSFMLDAFDQHHATYYGKLKSFDLDPDKEGVFEFQCPETSAQGKLIVFGPASMPPAPRSLSSE